MQKIIFLSVWVLFVYTASGQTKFEKESRLKEEKVPQTAKSFVRLDGASTRVRWYFEENLDGNSIEAKLKHDGNRYSIEFDTSGMFQDIELESVFDAIPLNTGTMIRKILDSEFEKYTIRKLQLQFSGNIKSLSLFLENPEREKEYTLKYEIVLKGRIEKEWALYELIFTSDGKLEKRSRIIFRNIDNLEF